MRGLIYNLKVKQYLLRLLPKLKADRVRARGYVYTLLGLSLFFKKGAKFSQTNCYFPQFQNYYIKNLEKDISMEKN